MDYESSYLDSIGTILFDYKSLYPNCMIQQIGRAERNNSHSEFQKNVIYSKFSDDIPDLTKMPKRNLSEYPTSARYLNVNPSKLLDKIIIKDDVDLLCSQSSFAIEMSKLMELLNQCEEIDEKDIIIDIEI